MAERSDIPADRLAEYDSLVSMLMEYASPEDADARDIAEWVARSSLKPVHLWQGMGVADRAEVRAILETHFPELAAGNTKDMRWKKYLYKRLCGWPGFAG